jgi:hypothetical protein
MCCVCDVLVLCYPVAMCESVLASPGPLLQSSRMHSRCSAPVGSSLLGFYAVGVSSSSSSSSLSLCVSHYFFLAHFHNHFLVTCMSDTHTYTHNHSLHPTLGLITISSSWDLRSQHRSHRSHAGAPINQARNHCCHGIGRWRCSTG